MNESMTKSCLPWLENTEKRIFNVLDALRDVYVEVLKGALKISTSDHSYICQSCQQENKVLNAKGKGIENHEDSYITKFNSEVELWKERCRLLRKKYKYLKKEISPPNKRTKKRNLSKKSNVSRNARLEDVTDQLERKRCVRDEEKPISRQSQRHEPEDVLLAANTEPEATGYDLNRESRILEESLMNETDGKQIIDITKDETSGEITRDDQIQMPDEQTGLSWKRAYPDLRSKRSLKVKYQDGTKKLSSSFINDFFKPKSIIPVRKINSKRSKRQISDASIETPQSKRQREVEREIGFDEVEEELIPEKSVAKNEEESAVNQVFRGKNHKEEHASRNIKASHLLSIDKKLVRSSVDWSPSRSHQSDHELKIAYDTAETISITRATDFNQSKRNDTENKKNISHSKMGPNITDMDATRWGLDEKVGLPSLASTPMVLYESSRMGCQNGNDFDDTMWSAPKSPSVVRSIFSTPEKSACSKKHGDKEENEVQDESPQILPGIKTIPVLSKDSRSQLTEIARDSYHKSRKDNLTSKTSDADLSCDMFHGSAENDASTKGDIVCNHSTTQEGNLIEKQSKQEYKQEKVTGVSDNDETFDSFHRIKKQDVNYKYNAVVRKRDDRDKMDGFECPECIAWYKDEVDFEEKKKHLKLVCRHKAISSPPPATPEGFWSIGFPDTPDYMKKGHMFNENDPLPLHAVPKERKDRFQKTCNRKKEWKDAPDSRW